MSENHIDIRLDDGLIIKNTVGGPTWSTSVVCSNSGKEQRNGNWETPRSKYDIGARQVTEEEMKKLRDFFVLVGGKRKSFKMKDWLDYCPTTFTGAYVNSDDGISGYLIEYKQVYGNVFTPKNLRADTVEFYLGWEEPYYVDVTSLCSYNESTGIVTFTPNFPLLQVVEITPTENGTTLIKTAVPHNLINRYAADIIADGVDGGEITGTEYWVANIIDNYTIELDMWSEIGKDYGNITIQLSPYAWNLIWYGEWDKIVRFDTDKFNAEFIAGIPTQEVDSQGYPLDVTNKIFYIDSLPVIEVR